jgi:hypothetical protein
MKGQRNVQPALVVRHSLGGPMHPQIGTTRRRPVFRRFTLGALMLCCGACADQCADPLFPDYWGECTSGAYPNLYGVHGRRNPSANSLNLAEVVIVGAEGTLLSGNENCEFSQVPVDVSTALRGAWVSDDGTGAWVTGGDWAEGGGVALKGADLQDSDALVIYNDVWGSSTCDVYFVGVGVMSFGHNVKHYTCTRWDSLEIDFGLSEITGVSGTASDDVWLVLGQSYANVWHYDGTAWEDRSEEWMDQPLYDVSAVQTGEVFAVGAAGTIYYFNGTAWEDHSRAELTQDLRGVWASETGTRAWAVGQDATVYRYTLGSWEADEVQEDVTVDLNDVWGIEIQRASGRVFFMLAVGDFF